MKRHKIIRLSIGALLLATSAALSQKGTLVKASLRHLPGFYLACFARIALARAFSFTASVVRPVFLNTAA